MKLRNITVGSDPELFIINTKTNNVVSAVGLIPGTKKEPWKADDMPKGFALQTDNILAEFNIPAVKDKLSFVKSIQYMQKYIDSYVKNINLDLGIKCASSKVVPNSELQSEQAQQFGCDVDYNIYTRKANPKPEGTKTNIRSCGFHLHLGYDNPNIDTTLALIKYMDVYLGIPSVIKDKDKKRRSLYGKAGCFRLCDYGFEYRVLSSAMMSNTAKLSFVWDQLFKAIFAYENDFDLPSEEDIQNIINNSNSKLAEQIISAYNLV